MRIGTAFVPAPLISLVLIAGAALLIAAANPVQAKKKHTMTSDECALIGGVVVITSSAGDMMCCSDSSHAHCATIKDPLVAPLRTTTPTTRNPNIRPLTPSISLPPVRGGAASVK